MGFDSESNFARIPGWDPKGLRVVWGMSKETATRGDCVMKRVQSFFVPVFVVVSLLLLLPSMLLADVTGSILGVVRDPSSAVVKGAKVRVTNTETNFSQETVTADDGSYRFLALPVGHYTVNVTTSGFQQFNATDIVLKVNDELRIDIALRVGNMKEEISIAADALQIETESTQLGDVIDSKKMLALPLNGRSYLDLLGLQAGVAPTTAGTIGGDRPVSGYISNAGNVSVNGQRETANAFLVNGGDVSEGRNLGAGLVPNLDSVEEFRSDHQQLRRGIRKVQRRGDERHHQVGHEWFPRRCFRVPAQRRNGCPELLPLRRA